MDFDRFYSELESVVDSFSTSNELELFGIIFIDFSQKCLSRITDSIFKLRKGDK